MSMYNMLFGVNKFSPFILAMLGKTPESFGRFRDCYFDEAGNIVVYTRCGGGNREGYQEVFEEMTQHPCFIREYDDSFDSTYCSFEFRVPETFRGQIDKFLDQNNSTPPAERWQSLFAELEKAKGDGSDSPLVQNALNVGKEIFSKIEQATKGQ